MQVNMFLVCVRSVVVTLTWPLWNMFLITAYGGSPGALLRVMRLFRCFSFLFSGWLRVARFIVALWPLHGVPNYPRSRIRLLQVWIGQFMCHVLMRVWFLFLLLNRGLCPFCCVVCSP